MDYSELLADEVCARLRKGETIRSICSTQGMPSTDDLTVWAKQSSGFARDYALAHLEGRPARNYDPEVAEEYCRRLTEGRSMRSVSADKDMPSRETITRWKEQFPEFDRAVTIAYEVGTDDLFERHEELAWETTPENANQKRVQSQVLMFNISKRNIKKYGDHQHIDMKASVAVTRELTLKEKSDVERIEYVRRLAFLLLITKEELKQPGCEQALALFYRAFPWLQERAIEASE